MLPLGPIAQFTYESRRALFLAAMEAAEHGDSERLTAYLAASFARSPSVAALVEGCGADLAAIVGDLNAAGSDPPAQMPEPLVAFWKQLEDNFAGAPEQSVTPAQVLLLLLEYDSLLRATFERHGFDVARFRNSVR